MFRALVAPLVGLGLLAASGVAHAEDFYFRTDGPGIGCVDRNAMVDIMQSGHEAFTATSASLGGVQGAANAFVAQVKGFLDAGVCFSIPQGAVVVAPGGINPVDFDAGVGRVENVARTMMFYVGNSPEWKLIGTQP